MNLSPDEIEVFRLFGLRVNMTLVDTWLVIALLFVFARLLSANSVRMPRARNFAEAAVGFVRDQVEGLLGRPADRFVPFIGSLFIFILACNWSALLPIPYPVGGGLKWYMAPTASASTTVALALVVLASCAYFGIERHGRRYFRKYFEPVFFLFPLNVLAEASRGFSLAVRLYGNIMSSGALGSVAFIVAPIVFPGLLSVYGLVAGTIQPYIFAVLAAVYIGSSLGEPTKADAARLAKLGKLRG
ncbi:MAG: F0F1 ATP synthase subunit A [Rickettsiales bacterium]|jgi:F-type H+-transporting ATPase subunit a|nr:F0F1 ATP synthase subunit A [Rickettsiales bacterium]